MFTLTLTIGIFTFITAVIVPALRERNQAELHAANHELNKIKLRWTRKAYPELHELSYRDIVRRFDVKEAYNRISVTDRSME